MNFRSMMLYPLDERQGVSIISMISLTYFWLANSSSQNSPDQITRISRRWQAKTQTSPNMQGQEMSPKGKATGLGTFTNTHAIPPTKNREVAVTKQTLVFLEESNLLRQERSMPGKTTAVMGSHEHFWLQVGLRVGNCSSMGKLYLFKKRLLQDCFQTMYKTVTTTSSSTIVTRKHSPANFRLVNLRIFISPTHMQILTMSFRIMFESLKYQPTVMAVPTLRLTSSRVRNQKVEMLKIFLLRSLMRKRKSSSLQQMATPRMPRMKLRMQRHILIPLQEKAPISAPMTSSTMNTSTSQQFISIARPPNDHGLEYIATTAIITVTKNISTIKPHSRVLGEYESRQQTQQEAVAEQPLEETVNWSISKQLRQCIEGWQLLVI